ncbi:MAG: peptidoglycan-binding protein [Acutalibacteraceae bacterium]
MAYSTISYGSSGNDVKKLQEKLNSAGYNLDVDGQFGPKTQSAVKDYQKKNGLEVDGIVGTNTWNSLNGGSAKNTVSQSTSKNSTTSAKTSSTSRPTYKESAALTAAKKQLAEFEAQKPDEFSSQYTEQLDSLVDKILGGEPFSYDVSEDALYDLYKEKYINQGKMAMADTAAQSAAMTGGYGSSYGTTAAQQAYQKYLTELNDIVPELHDRAYQKYLNDKAADKENLAIIQGLEENDYNRYRDKMGDFYTDRDYLYGKTSDMSDDDYQKYLQLVNNWENDRTFNETVRQYNEQMAYQRERDAVADEQWEKTFALQKSTAHSGSSGDSGSRVSSSGVTKLSDLSEGIRYEITGKLEAYQGRKDANGKIGANYEMAEDLAYFQEIYGLSDDLVDTLYQKYSYNMPVITK